MIAISVFFVALIAEGIILYHIIKAIDYAETSKLVRNSYDSGKEIGCFNGKQLGFVEGKNIGYKLGMEAGKMGGLVEERRPVSYKTSEPGGAIRAGLDLRTETNPCKEVLIIGSAFNGAVAKAIEAAENEGMVNQLATGQEDPPVPEVYVNPVAPTSGSVEPEWNKTQDGGVVWQNLGEQSEVLPAGTHVCGTRDLEVGIDLCPKCNNLYQNCCCDLPAVEEQVAQILAGPEKLAEAHLDELVGQKLTESYLDLVDHFLAVDGELHVAETNECDAFHREGIDAAKAGCEEKDNPYLPNGLGVENTSAAEIWLKGYKETSSGITVEEKSSCQQAQSQLSGPPDSSPASSKTTSVSSLGLDSSLSGSSVTISTLTTSTTSTKRKRPSRRKPSRRKSRRTRN